MNQELFSALEDCLRAVSVEQKIHRVEVLHKNCATRTPETHATRPLQPLVTVAEVGFPERPVLLKPKHLPRRGFHSIEGRIALLHSIAHIEFNAINLALDAAYRFRGLPSEYYSDWLQVAAEEVQHFGLLRKRLNALGVDYGDLPGHQGLWEMAKDTAHDVLARMALVPRYLEARGLDVTPAMIDKLQGVGDEASAAILTRILKDEVGHVSVGSRWFRYVCRQRRMEPVATFFRLVKEILHGEIRGPFNNTLRRQAGFSEEELEQLSAYER